MQFEMIIIKYTFFLKNNKTFILIYLMRVSLKVEINQTPTVDDEKHC